MKHWQETEQIMRETALAGEVGEVCALAVSIDVDGSVYRRAGSKLLIKADGTVIGGVSSGCLESELKEVARRVIQTGVPQKLHYDTSEVEDIIWGFGLGCKGSVDLIVFPCNTDDFRRFQASMTECLRHSDPITLALALRDHELRFLLLQNECVSGLDTIPESFREVMDAQIRHQHQKGASSVKECDGWCVFTEMLYPPADLIICGAGDDSKPLVRYASEMGFKVTLLDHRRSYVTEERFPEASRLLHARAEDAIDLGVCMDNALVIIKSHVFLNDQAWLEYFAATEVPYIGLMGPKSRREELLSKSGLTIDLGRIYGPVGLDIGADGPEQIAMSMVAEALAVYAGRRPQHLRDRNKAIHSDR